MKSYEHMSAGIHSQRRRRGIAVALLTVVAGADTRRLARGQVLHEHVGAIIGVAADEVGRKALKCDEHTPAGVHRQRRRNGIVAPLRPIAGGADQCRLARGQILHEHIRFIVGVTADQVRGVAQKCHEHLAAAIHGDCRCIGLEIALRPVAVGADSRRDSRHAIPQEHIVGLVGVTRNQVR